MCWRGWVLAAVVAAGLTPAWRSPADGCYIGACLPLREHSLAIELCCTVQPNTLWTEIAPVGDLPHPYSGALTRLFEVRDSNGHFFAFLVKRNHRLYFLYWLGMYWLAPCLDMMGLQRVVWRRNAVGDTALWSLALRLAVTCPHVLLATCHVLTTMRCAAQTISLPQLRDSRPATPASAARRERPSAVVKVIPLSRANNISIMLHSVSPGCLVGSMNGSVGCQAAVLLANTA